MSHTAIYALVLLAAIGHASWNALVKNSNDRLLMLGAIGLIELLTGLVIAALVPPPASASLPYLLAAAAIHYAYYALMLNAYRVGDMSQVYPIARGMAPLLVVFLGIFLSGDVLNAHAILAICILSAGVLVLALSGQVINRPAVVFALGTGVAIAGYSFLSGLGVRKSGSIFGYIAWLEIATGLGMSSAAYLKRRRVLPAFVRSQWRQGALAGVLSVVGYAIALWAMARAPIAPVVAVRETSVVFAAIIGSLFLGEGFASRRVAAAVAVTVGVVLLALSTR